MTEKVFDPEKWVFIRIHERTRRALLKKGVKGQTYADIIDELMTTGDKAKLEDKD